MKPQTFDACRELEEHFHYLARMNSITMSMAGVAIGIHAECLTEDQLRAHYTKRPKDASERKI